MRPTYELIMMSGVDQREIRDLLTGLTLRADQHTKRQYFTRLYSIVEYGNYFIHKVFKCFTCKYNCSLLIDCHIKQFRKQERL